MNSPFLNLQVEDIISYSEVYPIHPLFGLGPIILRRSVRSTHVHSLFGRDEKLYGALEHLSFVYYLVSDCLS